LSLFVGNNLAKAVSYEKFRILFSPFSPCFLPVLWLYCIQGATMAVKIKPVQATEIKDKKIIREVIAQIRKPITPEIIERNRKIDELAEKVMRP
jgi:hypothetical protein